MSAPGTPADDRRSAVFAMAVATVFFFGMSASVRFSGLPTLQVVFFRGLIALLLCAAQLRWEGVAMAGTLRGLLLLRGMLGTAALVCFFWAVQHLPLATAVVLQNLSPLTTALLAAVVLGERLRPAHAALFLLALAGVLLVRPPEGAPLTSLAVGLAGALLSSGAYVTIGRIGRREHPLVIVLWFPLVTVPVIGPLLPRVWVDPTPAQWGWLLGVGICVQIAQVFMTRAYQIGPAGVVSLVSYLGVAWAAVGGWWLFDEALGPRALVGMALVLAAVAGTARLKPAAAA